MKTSTYKPEHVITDVRTHYTMTTLSEYTNPRGEIIKPGDRIVVVGSKVVREVSSIYLADDGTFQVHGYRVTPGPAPAAYLNPDKVRLESA